MFTLSLVFSLLACSSEQPPKPAEPVKEAAKEAPKPAAPAVDAAKLGLFGALPARMDNPANATSAEKVALGRMLYYDKRLSKNHDVSCNSCHNLATFGVDNQPTSTGHKGQKGGRNSPTSLNAAGHFVQFWDGRAADVEAQAKGPVLNPVEMAMKDEAAVVAVLKSIPDYGPAFAAAFPGEKDPITYDNMAKAIGDFERGLVTPSKWDRYLGGDTAALSPDELKGFNTFVDTGCATCHNGVYVGGASYQKVGVVSPWPNQADKGRGDLTKNEADNFMFKVPGLRNIDKTGPYFHDGGTTSLDEAVKLMAKHQLGKDLSEAQVKEITTWLATLTGEVSADYVKEPALPASGPKTPKPDPT